MQAQTYSYSIQPYTWDTVTTNANLRADDAVGGPFNIGFSFPMGGKTYTQVYIDTNGNLKFGSPATDPYNVAVPNSSLPSPFLAVWWDDLRTDYYSWSGVTYGTLGTAPSRRFVVSYNWSTNVGQIDQNTFQVALFEDGTIEYRYGSMSNWSSATVGVQLTGSDATSYPGSPGLTTMAKQTLRFTAATKDSALPGGVSGHAWWSRADSLVGAVVDGGGITTWTNAASYAKNLTGSTTKPVFVNNNATNINFNPVVSFTSSTSTAAAAQFFTAPSFLGTTAHSQTHVVYVGYPTGAAARRYLMWEGSVASRLSIGLPWTDGALWWTSGNVTTDTVVCSSCGQLNQPNLVSAYKDSANNVVGSSSKQVVRLNSTLWGKPTSTALTANGSNFYLGWQPVEAASVPFNGVLAEGVLLVDKALNSWEAGQIESYLALKYGITRGGNGSSGTAVYDTAGGWVWDVGTGYHYNLTGIARNDITKLDQRISRSSNPGTQITLVSGSSMPSAASAISAQAGTAFTVDKSYVVLGDNNGSVSTTGTIASGPLAGATIGSRVWRTQTTGTAPATVTVCIPDALIPASLLASGSLQLTMSTAANFSGGLTSFAVSSGNCPGTGLGVTTSVPGRLATLSKAALEASSRVSYLAFTAAPALDHLEVTTSVSAGVTCAPVTFTIKACGNAACSAPYTGGLSGTLTVAGPGMAVNFPAGAAYTIASGSDSSTLAAHVTTAGTVTAGAGGLSLTPANAKPVFCGIGVAAASANSCNLAVSSAGFLFDVPHHRSASSQTVSIRAVKQADNSLACVPAFAGTKAVNFKCSYLNPSTGTLPVLVGGTAVNAAGNAAAACDASGGSRSVAFDATGTATLAVQYNDAGQVRLAATYTGSGTEAGLVLAGSDDFIAAPYDFSVTGIPSSLIAAGSTFSARVTARNFAGGTTPNFGREASAEGAVIDFVRSQPLGSGAVSGTFTGNLGSFSAGTASASNLSWTEVGKGNVSARLGSGSYLGTGMTLAGSSAGGPVSCASEGGNCVLPTGVTGTVYYGAAGKVAVLADRSGTVACNNNTFADPIFGVGKSCSYVATGGAGTASLVAAGFRPHHFDVTTRAACGVFSYAGQPFSATVTARNASGGTTLNFDGGANTSPNMARLVTISEASGNATGSLSGTAIAASAFASGVGVASSLAFGFSNKLTVPQTISLRATDTDGVSSSGYTEGSMALRSGRLRLSNAFGSAKAALQVPVVAEYWLDQAWVHNPADHCTVVANAAVALSNPRGPTGGGATATTSAAGFALIAGRANLLLAAPTPAGSSLSVDVAVNLGSTGTDQSCQASHPASTGAAQPWLRSFNGACAATPDRDPAARASFGIFSPETRKVAHIRDLY